MIERRHHRREVDDDRQYAKRKDETRRTINCGQWAKQERRPFVRHADRGRDLTSNPLEDRRGKWHTKNQSAQHDLESEASEHYPPGDHAAI